MSRPHDSTGFALGKTWSLGPDSLGVSLPLWPSSALPGRESLYTREELRGAPGPIAAVATAPGWSVRGLDLTGSGQARMLEPCRGLAFGRAAAVTPAPTGSPARQAGVGASCCMTQAHDAPHRPPRTDSPTHSPSGSTLFGSPP